MTQQYDQPPPQQQQPPPQQQQPQYQQPPPQYQQPMPSKQHLHSDIIQRFIALLVDYIILGIIFIVILAVLFFTGVVTGGFFGFIFNPFAITVGAVVVSLILFAISLLYFMVQEGGPMSATIGKQIIGIKVVDENYQPIDMSKAFVRNVFRAMWSLPFSIGTILFIIDVVLVIIHPDKQRLGDIIAHTYVVREDATSGPQPYYAPPPPQYQQPQPQYQQPAPQEQQPPPPPPAQPEPQPVNPPDQ